MQWDTQIEKGGGGKEKGGGKLGEKERFGERKRRIQEDTRREYKYVIGMCGVTREDVCLSSHLVFAVDERKGLGRASLLLLIFIFYIDSVSV